MSQHPWDHVEGAPYGTRGGSVVEHVFPADAEYIFEVDLVSGSNARVNVNSLDSSVNVVSVDRRQLFEAMKRTTEDAALEPTLKAELERRIAALEASGSGPSLVRRFGVSSIRIRAATRSCWQHWRPPLRRSRTNGRARSARRETFLRYGQSESFSLSAPRESVTTRRAAKVPADG